MQMIPEVRDSPECSKAILNLEAIKKFKPAYREWHCREPKFLIGSETDIKAFSVWLTTCGGIPISEEKQKIEFHSLRLISSKEVLDSQWFFA